MLVRFNGWLDKKTVAALKEISKQEDRPIGWLVRKAVERFVAEWRLAKRKSK
jgi:hypothetical protein